MTNNSENIFALVIDDDVSTDDVSRYSKHHNSHRRTRA